MNLSIFVMTAGAVLLFAPQTSWLGIAFLAIGLVTYMVGQREPLAIAQTPPKYMQALPQRAGVSWSIKDPMAQQQEGPRIEEGVFSLPLPIDPNIGRFVDVKYRVPTKAKGFTQEMEKPGHPLIPGF
jgi:hypothetical protein